MKKTIRIVSYKIIFTVIFVLLLNVSACSAPEANQDIDPADIVRAILDNLGIDPSDVGTLFYSEGDEDHIYEDMFLRIMFPPSRNPGGDIVYTMDLFDQYAIIQYEKHKPVIFEIGIFKVSKSAHENDMAYRNNLSRIETMCQERIARVKRQAMEYKPELAFIADKSNVFIFDNYVYYVIAEDSAAGYSTIRSKLTVKD